MADNVVGTSVYVIGDTLNYHLDPDCGPSRDDREFGGRLTSCTASAAHRSCLTPCPICAAPLAAALNSTLGSVPSGERRRRSLPNLQAVASHELPPTSRCHRGRSGRTTDTSETRAPYGAPRSADDVRFTNASQVGWGTTSFGQNHDEFLGETTDDDNDWRGRANRFMD